MPYTHHQQDTYHDLSDPNDRDERDGFVYPDDYLRACADWLQDTATDSVADEKIMRDLELKMKPIAVPESAKATFRQGVFVEIGMYHEGLLR